MKYLVIISGKKGGAEEVMLDFADYLTNDGLEVRVYCFGSTGHVNFQIIRRLIKGVLLFNLVINSGYTCVISTYREINIIVGIFSKFKSGISLIFRESSISEIRDKKTRQNWYKFLINYAYKNALIWVQSSDSKSLMSSRYNFRTEKILIQGNWIKNKMNEHFVTFKSLPEGGLNLILITRMNDVKRHDLILEIIEKFNIPVAVHVFGEFDSTLCENMYAKFNHYGFVDSWWKHLNINDSYIYLQTSDVEGFPNSMLEAMALNIPAVSLECLGGTKDLVGHGIGFYVERDTEKAYEAVLQLYNRKFICFYLDSFRQVYNRKRAIENVRISSCI